MNLWQRLGSNIKERINYGTMLIAKTAGNMRILENSHPYDTDGPRTYNTQLVSENRVVSQNL